MQIIIDIFYIYSLWFIMLQARRQFPCSLPTVVLFLPNLIFKKLVTV